MNQRKFTRRLRADQDSAAGCNWGYLVGTLALIVEIALVTIIVGMSSARWAQAVSAANSRPDTVELMRAGSARTGDTQPQANWN
ncbi:MAG: hypothetical protein QOF92_2950 [Pseudonocardiales bacterium]|nr:hypothetical protein [Pseudonocardiales bacterium]